jgi:hypothetical protein
MAYIRSEAERLEYLRIGVLVYDITKDPCPPADGEPFSPREEHRFQMDRLLWWEMEGLVISREEWLEEDLDEYYRELLNAEALIEDQINAYIEECESDDPHIDKLADLAANAEDKPVFRGRRKRIQVAGVPV